MLEDSNIIKKFMFVGSFSKFGFGRIYLFKENSTGKKLVEIYKRMLLPFSKMIKSPHWILLEDNDPKHTSNIEKTWRENHQIDRIYWSRNSPDLNHIHIL